MAKILWILFTTFSSVNIAGEANIIKGSFYQPSLVLSFCFVAAFGPCFTKRQSHHFTRSLDLSAGIQSADVPNHIAYIVDGNGRWAIQKGT